MDFVLLEGTRFFKNLFLGAGWILLLVSAAGVLSKSPRWRQVFWRAALFYPLACTMPPIHELLTLLLLHVTPQALPSPAGAIVVLGAGNTPEGAPTTPSAIRALRGAQLWQQGFAPFVIPSGGFTKPSPLTEAQSMALVLKGQGVPSQQIILENKSLNTYENAVETARLLRIKGITKILLVTSQVHLLRSTLTFEGQGVEVIPISAEPQGYMPNWNPVPTWQRALELQILLNEYVGLLGYGVQGKLTKPKNF